jgi:general secretion pathway protein E
VAVGCDRCGHTGFQGRVGVYELLETNEHIRSQIHNQAAEADIRHAALKSGMKTMHDDGQRWVQEGITTEAELLRVTKVD